MFNDEAQKVVGMTAQELGTLMENDKEAAINSLDKIHFKQFIFKCRAKIENYNVRCCVCCLKIADGFCVLGWKSFEDDCG